MRWPRSFTIPTAILGALALAACSRMVLVATTGATTSGAGGTTSGSVAVSTSATTTTGGACDAAVGPGKVEWAEVLSDYAGGIAITSGAGGHVIVLGAFALSQGAIDVDGGPLSPSAGTFFVLDLDGCGAPVWSKAFGGSTSAQPRVIATDAAGDIYFAGGIGPGSVDFGGGALAGPDSNAFLVKLDPAGHHLWSKRFSVPGVSGASNVLALAVDPSGGAVIAGRFGGELDLGDGAVTSSTADDRFVASFSEAGALRWKMILPKAVNDGILAVAVGPSGEVAMTGTFYQSISFGGAPLISAGVDDIFVVKVDALGQHLWSQRFGSPLEDAPGGVAIGPDGAVLVSAFLEQGANLGTPFPGPPGLGHDAVAVFEPGGALRWSADAVALVGGTHQDSVGRDAKFDASGNAVILLEYFDIIPDFIVTRLDPAGALRWTHSFGKWVEVTHPSLAVDPGGALLLTGGLQAPIDFGTGPLSPTSHGSGVLVVKVAP
jgi:hypothetical protein